MIYRLAEPQDWSAAQRQGSFASADLAAEGFIHFSERHQVEGVARRYYSGRDGLILLMVDETRLGTAAPLKRENTTGGTELFPHVYGAVPLDAVIRSAPFHRNADGTVAWPDAV
jgi:hypothetical protein